MVFRRVFGGDEEPEKARRGAVTIRVEFGGQTFVQTYEDLDMAQLRFPQYLADLNTLYGRQIAGETEPER